MIISLAFIVIAGAFVIAIIAGIINGTKKAFKRSPPVSDPAPDELENELHELNKAEQIEIIDQTLIDYNKLLDMLTYQYQAEYNEREKAKLLSKRIATLEKYNRALKQREKLE